MKPKLIKKGCRFAVIKMDDGGHYNTKKEYEISIRETKVVSEPRRFKTNKSIVPIFTLKPGTDYTVYIEEHELSFRTDKEFVTLCVRDFGAKGNGVQDDTVYIQAAIMACPPKSRVLIPPGDYLVTNLFLMSNVKIEILKGARLIMNTERYAHAVLPGIIESYDGLSEYNLGTWEGNPLSKFASCINALNVSNVEIYGEGEIFGNASDENWWHDAKVKRGAWRPRLFFTNASSDISVIGLTFKNSPSWNIHPYFSKNLEFIALNIINPADSPNTDGIDVECCKNVHIIGVHFDVGDDCIALKSCKIYMAEKYKRTCENIYIANCLMESGHGALTVGSEMAGGVKGVIVSHCFFLNTDRGLRVKTRRGRGRLSILDDITFSCITMDNVQTPFAVNSFYFCDPDGKSDYVQNTEPLPIDHRTPQIKTLVIEDVVCENAHIAAAYFTGLPERKIEQIIMRNVRIKFADDAKTGEAEMRCNIPPMSKHGIYACNVNRLLLENVVIENHEGDDLVVENVNEVERG
ncbi:MAG: glycoside hydrolase family 28 protein [Oscillospiraceae bacterium]|nr:glycoside hydrolase family 28 protein [Oscillospiraceae bacterium]